MKTAILRTLFHLAVFLLAIVFLMPGYPVLEYLLPIERMRDRLFPGIVIIATCVWAADRIVSLLFLKSRISGERWSVFSHGRSRTTSRLTSST